MKHTHTEGTLQHHHQQQPVPSFPSTLFLFLFLFVQSLDFEESKTVPERVVKAFTWECSEIDEEWTSSMVYVG